MKNNKKIKRIVMIGIMSSILVVLQLLSNYIQVGILTFNLALIPIIVGAILFGPKVGLLLGVVDGVLVFLGPSTQAMFYPYGIFKTLFFCILKTAVAGYVSGLIFKLFKDKKYRLSICLSSIVVPILNTGIFALTCILFYKDMLQDLSGEGANIVRFLFVDFISINFITEFFVVSSLSFAIYSIIELGIKKFNITE